MDFDFCRTLDELGQQLDQDTVRERPLFAQTRSLNLHVAAVRNGYVPPDKQVGKCESAVASNVAKYVKCVLKCRQQKADKALSGKDFDEQACQNGPKGCRAAYDKKVASLIAKGDCPSCLGDVAQGLLADDVRDDLTDVKGRTYCEGTVPLAP